MPPSHPITVDFEGRPVQGTFTWHGAVMRISCAYGSAEHHERKGGDEERHAEERLADLLRSLKAQGRYP